MEWCLFRELRVGATQQGRFPELAREQGDGTACRRMRGLPYVFTVNLRYGVASFGLLHPQS